jgi:flavodoxin
MNILILYYSESGNTRKVAEAMASGLSSAPDTIVDLRCIEKVNPARWENYDLIFIGTPAISWTVAEPVKKAFENFPADTRPVFKLALFVTYGVPDIQFYGECIGLVKSYCQKLNVEYLGEYCCLGEHRVIDRLAQIHPEKVPLAQTSLGHPDETDLKKAADFAVDIYSQALDES